MGIIIDKWNAHQGSNGSWDDNSDDKKKKELGRTDNKVTDAEHQASGGIITKMFKEKDGATLMGSQGIKESLQDVERTKVGTWDSMVDSVTGFVTDITDLVDYGWGRFVTNQDKKRGINDLKKYNEIMSAASQTQDANEQNDLMKKLEDENVIDARQYSINRQKEESGEKYKFEQAKQNNKDVIFKKIGDVIGNNMAGKNLSKYQTDVLSATNEAITKQVGMAYDSIMNAYENTRDESLLKAWDDNQEELMNNVSKFVDEFSRRIVDRNMTYKEAYSSMIKDNSFKDLANGITSITRKLDNKMYKQTILSNLSDAKTPEGGVNVVNSLLSGLTALKNTITWGLSQVGQGLEEGKEAFGRYDIVEDLYNLGVMKENSSQLEQLASKVGWFGNYMIDTLPQWGPGALELLVTKKLSGVGALKKMNSVMDKSANGYLRAGIRRSTKFLQDFTMDNLVYDEAFQLITGGPITNYDENINLATNILTDSISAWLQAPHRMYKPSMAVKELVTDEISEDLLNFIVRNSEGKGVADLAKEENEKLLNYLTDGYYLGRGKEIDTGKVKKLVKVENLPDDLKQLVRKVQDGATGVWGRLNAYKGTIDDIMLSVAEKKGAKELSKLSTVDIIEKELKDALAGAEMMRKAAWGLNYGTKSTGKMINTAYAEGLLNDDALKAMLLKGKAPDDMFSLVKGLATGDIDLIQSGVYGLEKKGYQLDYADINAIYNNIAADLLESFGDVLIRPGEGTINQYIRGNDGMFYNMFDVNRDFGLSQQDLIKKLRDVSSDGMFGSSNLTSLDALADARESIRAGVFKSADVTKAFPNIKVSTDAEKKIYQSVLKKNGFEVREINGNIIIKGTEDAITNYLNRLSKLEGGIADLNAGDLEALKLKYFQEHMDMFKKYLDGVGSEYNKVEDVKYSADEFAKQYKTWFEKLFKKDANGNMSIQEAFDTEDINSQFQSIIQNNGTYKQIEEMAASALVADCLSKKDVFRTLKETLTEGKYFRGYYNEIVPIINSLIAQTGWLKTLGINSKQSINLIGDIFGKLLVDVDTIRTLSVIDSKYLFTSVLANLMSKTEGAKLMYQDALSKAFADLSKQGKSIIPLQDFMDKVETLGRVDATKYSGFNPSVLNKKADELKAKLTELNNRRDLAKKEINKTSVNVDNELKEAKEKLEGYKKHPLFVGGISEAKTQEDIAIVNEIRELRETIGNLEKKKASGISEYNTKMYSPAITEYEELTTEYNKVRKELLKVQADIKKGEEEFGTLQPTKGNLIDELSKMKNTLLSLDDNKEKEIKKQAEDAMKKFNKAFDGKFEVSSLDNTVTDADLKLISELVAYKSAITHEIYSGEVVNRVFENIYGMLRSARNSGKGIGLSFSLTQGAVKDSSKINLSVLGEAQFLSLLTNPRLFTNAVIGGIGRNDASGMLNKIVDGIKEVRHNKMPNSLTLFNNLEKYFRRGLTNTQQIDNLVDILKNSNLLDKQTIIDNVMDIIAKEGSANHDTIQAVASDLALIDRLEDAYKELENLVASVNAMSILEGHKIDITDVQERLSKVGTIYDRARELITSGKAKDTDTLRKVLSEESTPAELRKYRSKINWYYNNKEIDSAYNLVKSTWRKGTNTIDETTDLSNMSLNLKGKTLYVYDLETNGIKDNQEIIQVGILKIQEVKGKPQVVDRITKKFKPETPITKDVEELTGITNDSVSNLSHFRGSELEGQLKEIFSDKNNIIVGHNSNVFDTPTLTNGWDTKLEAKHIDTLALTKLYMPQEQTYRLGNLVNRFGNIKSAMEGVKGGAHDALYDVEMTYNLFKFLTNHGLSNGKVKDIEEIIKHSEDATRDLKNFHYYSEDLTGMDFFDKQMLSGQGMKYGTDAEAFIKELDKEFPEGAVVQLSDVLPYLGNRMGNDKATLVLEGLAKIIPEGKSIDKYKLFTGENTLLAYQDYATAVENAGGLPMTFESFALNRIVNNVLSACGMNNIGVISSLEMYVKDAGRRSLMEKLSTYTKKGRAVGSDTYDTLNAIIDELIDKGMLKAEDSSSEAIANMKKDIKDYFMARPDVIRQLNASYFRYLQNPVYAGDRFQYALKNTLRDAFYPDMIDTTRAINVSNLEAGVDVVKTDTRLTKYRNGEVAHDTTGARGKAVNRGYTMEKLEQGKLPKKEDVLNGNETFTLYDLASAIAQDSGVEINRGKFDDEALERMAYNYEEILDALRYGTVTVDEIKDVPAFKEIAELLLGAKNKDKDVISDDIIDLMDAQSHSLVYQEARDSVSIKLVDDTGDIEDLGEEVGKQVNEADNVVNQADIADSISDNGLDELNAGDDELPDLYGGTVNASSLDGEGFTIHMSQILQDKMLGADALLSDAKFEVLEDGASMANKRGLQFNVGVSTLSRVNGGDVEGMTNTIEKYIASHKMKEGEGNPPKVMSAYNALTSMNKTRTDLNERQAMEFYGLDNLIGKEVKGGEITDVRIDVSFEDTKNDEWYTSVGQRLSKGNVNYTDLAINLIEAQNKKTGTMYKLGGAIDERSSGRVKVLIEKKFLNSETGEYEKKILPAFWYDADGVWNSPVGKYVLDKLGFDGEYLRGQNPKDINEFLYDRIYQQAVDEMDKAELIKKQYLSMIEILEDVDDITKGTKRVNNLPKRDDETLLNAISYTKELKKRYINKLSDDKLNTLISKAKANAKEKARFKINKEKYNVNSFDEQEELAKDIMSDVNDEFLARDVKSKDTWNTIFAKGYLSYNELDEVAGEGGMAKFIFDYSKAKSKNYSKELQDIVVNDRAYREEITSRYNGGLIKLFKTLEKYKAISDKSIPGNYTSMVDKLAGFYVIQDGKRYRVNRYRQTYSVGEYNFDFGRADLADTPDEVKIEVGDFIHPDDNSRLEDRFRIAARPGNDFLPINYINNPSQIEVEMVDDKGNLIQGVIKIEDGMYASNGGRLAKNKEGNVIGMVDDTRPTTWTFYSEKVVKKTDEYTVSPVYKEDFHSETGKIYQFRGKERKVEYIEYELKGQMGLDLRRDYKGGGFVPYDGPATNILERTKKFNDIMNKDADDIIEGATPVENKIEDLIKSRFLQFTNYDIAEKSGDLKQIIGMNRRFMDTQGKNLNNAVANWEDVVRGLSPDDRAELYRKIRGEASKQIAEGKPDIEALKLDFLSEEQQKALDGICKVFKDGGRSPMYQVASLTTSGFDGIVKNIAHNHLGASQEFFKIANKSDVERRLKSLVAAYEKNEKRATEIVGDIMGNPLGTGTWYNFMSGVRDMWRFIKYGPIMYPLSGVLMLVNSAVMGVTRYLGEAKAYNTIMDTDAFKILTTRRGDKVIINGKAYDGLGFADSLNRTDEIMFNSNSDLGGSWFAKSLDLVIDKIPFEGKTKEIIATAMKGGTHSLFDITMQGSIKSMALAKALAKNGYGAHNMEAFMIDLMNNNISTRRINDILADTERIYSRFFTNSATSLFSRHRYSRWYMINALQGYVINRTDEMTSSLKDAVNWIHRRREGVNMYKGTEGVNSKSLGFTWNEFTDYLQNENQELQSFLMNILMSAKIGYYIDKIASGGEDNQHNYRNYVVDTSDYLSALPATFMYSILSAPFEGLIDYADYAETNYDDFNLGQGLTVAGLKTVSEVCSKFFREGKVLSALMDSVVAYGKTGKIDFAYDVLQKDFEKIANGLGRYQLVEGTNMYGLDNMTDDKDILGQILFNADKTTYAGRITSKLQSLSTVDSILNGENGDFWKNTLLPYLPVIGGALQNAITGQGYSFSAAKYKQLQHIMDTDNTVQKLINFDLQSGEASEIFGNSNLFTDDSIGRMYKELTAFDYSNKQQRENGRFDTGYQDEVMKEEIFTKALEEKLGYDDAELVKRIVASGDTGKIRGLEKIMAAAEAKEVGSAKIVIGYMASQLEYNMLKQATGKDYPARRDIDEETQNAIQREVVKEYYPYMILADKTSWYKAITEYTSNKYSLFKDLYKDEDLTGYVSTLGYMDMLTYQQAKEGEVNAHFIKNSWSMLSKYFKTEKARINAINYTMNAIENAGFSKEKATEAKMGVLAANMDFYDKYANTAMAQSLYGDDIDRYNHFVWGVYKDGLEIQDAEKSKQQYKKYGKSKRTPYATQSSGEGVKNPILPQFLPQAQKYLQGKPYTSGGSYSAPTRSGLIPGKDLKRNWNYYEKLIKVYSDKLVKSKPKTYPADRVNTYLSREDNSAIKGKQLYFPKHKQPKYSTKVLSNLPGSHG